MSLQLQTHDPYTVTVDGQVIRLSIRRMSPVEHAVFLAQWNAFRQGRRKPAPAPESIEESPEAFAQRMKAAADHAADNARWLEEVFEAYVTVEAGDLKIGDEVITTGTRFAQAMAGYGPVVSDVLTEIFLLNTLTPLQKKTWSSLRALRTGSKRAPLETASGSAPAPAAMPAGKKGSVRSAAATARSKKRSSGTTDPSSSVSVPSGS